MSVFNTITPLLELLERRHKALGLGDGGKYRRPQINEQAAYSAARDWGDVNRSDPFARARMSLHLRQGYVMLSEVQADVRHYRQARQRQQAAE